MTISPDEDNRLELLNKLKDVTDDFKRYCLNNLKIKNKSGEIVSLVFNPIQEIIIQKVLDDLRNGRPIRYIILKARKEGVSTLVEALIYWWTATHKNVKSKIVAQDQDTAEELFAMFKRYHENSLPIFKPTAKYSTRTDVTFDREDGTGLKSQIDVASAKTTSTGRGQTIQWVHGSEVAYWADGSEIMSGLLQAVPTLPETGIFLESTANGMGDFFHKTWQAAKAGDSVFTPLFFSWLDDPTYILPVPENFKPTDEEKKLMLEHGAKPEQIAWRREKIKEFADNPAKFYQEYPTTDIEAFLASGQSRFNIGMLVKMEEKAYEPKYYDLLEEKTTNKDNVFQKPMSLTAFRLVEVPNSPLKIWKQPTYGRRYVIGADVAEGIGGDYSVATIMDIETTETVARWRGDCEPAEFGEVLEQLGRFYNRALIACEINNHGLTTVQRLRDMHYDNLYRREKGYDERFEEMTTTLGWKTDRKTKPLMINALSEAIYTGKLTDYDKVFIRECMEYVVDDRGRTNAQVGSHDDTVISTAIALQVFDWTDVVIQNRSVPSRIPQKYLDIRKKHASMLKVKR